MLSVDADCHPDPLAEEVRQAVVVDELIQAIGRGRAVRRGPDLPLDVVVYGNTPLPLPLAKLTEWQPPDFDRSMVGELGVWLEPNGDAAKAMGRSEAAVEKARQRKVGAFQKQTSPKKNILLKEGLPLPCAEAPPPTVVPRLATAIYRKVGARFGQHRMEFDPVRIADPRGWLDARLGAIASFTPQNTLKQASPWVDRTGPYDLIRPSLSIAATSSVSMAKPVSSLTRRRQSRAQLSLKQQRFVREYAHLGNATEAARRAGYKQTNSISQIAHENLRKPLVASAIREEIQRIDAEVTPQRVQRRLDEIGRAAEEAKQFGPAIRAEELLGKSIGMFIDRSLQLSGLLNDGHVTALLELAKRRRAEPIDLADDEIDT